MTKMGLINMLEKHYFRYPHAMWRVSCNAFDMGILLMSQWEVS